MKLSKKQLRTLIREEVQHRRVRMLEAFVRRLNELHPGSDLGTLLQQGIEKMWEADNFFQKALEQAPDDATWKLVNSLHAAAERVAFEFDARMQKIVSAAAGNLVRSNMPSHKKAPPGVHTR